MSIWKRAMDYLGLGPDDAYDDYDLPPFSEQGGITTAHQLFGDQLNAVVDELNEVLGG